MIRLFAAVAGLALSASVAAAQWQVPNNTIPIGRGGGQTGFKFNPGVTLDPATGNLVTAGSITGAAGIFSSLTLGAALPVASGGTGATSASAARTALGLAIGTNVQAWDADLDAIAALSGTGGLHRTGTGTWALRTLTGTASQITVTNGDGVSGNPTIAFTTQANNTVLGNVSGGAAAPIALTATQITTLCNLVTTSLSGCAPVSPGGSTSYLRADNTWAVPPTGAGSNPGGATGAVQFNSASAFAGDTNLFWDNTNKRLGISTNSPSVLASLGGGLANTKLAIFDNGSSIAGLGYQSGEFRFHLPANTNNFKFYDAPGGSLLFTIVGTGGILVPGTVTATTFSGSVALSNLPTQADQTVLGYATTSGGAAHVPIAIPNDFLNVKYYGVTLDGATNDTAAWNNAIDDANTRNMGLYCPAGMSRVVAGSLHVLNVPFLGPMCNLRGFNSTAGCLLTVNYATPSPTITNGDPQSIVFDIGGFYDYALVSGPTITPGTQTGLCIQRSWHTKYTIRNAQSLSVAVLIDLAANPVANNAQFTENEMWLKGNVNGDVLKITANNASYGADANKFYLTTSYNNTGSIVNLAGDTNQGATSNTFEFTDMEIPQLNSYGVTASGRNRGNIFLARGMRGVNGGKYFNFTDNSTCGNVIIPQQWTPTNNTLSCPAANGSNQVQAINASDGTTTSLGRSTYFAPGPSAAVDTNIPCVEGDTVFNTIGGFSQPLSWRCSTGGLTGSGAIWTPNYTASVSPPNGVIGACPFTLNPYNPIVLFGNIGATCTVTLPAPASYSGLVITAFNYGANLIQSNASNVVDVTGAIGTQILPATAGKWTTLQSDGTYWRIFSYN